MRKHFLKRYIGFTLSEVLIAKRERGKRSSLNLSRTMELKVPFGRFLKQCAFTLAEVLITLGIIGVIAEVTIPTLMNKTNDTEMKAGLKEAYSIVSQAITKTASDNGGSLIGWVVVL